MGEQQRIDGLLTAFYRDEMRRVVSWRDRLDRTTNWAVVLTATLLTWAFGSTDRPHYVLLIALGGVGFFLWIEARRYRVYDVWRSRLRLIEEHLFADALDADGSRGGDWRRLLAEDLRRPALKIGRTEALQRRLRRVYFPLLVVLVVAWGLRVTVFPPGDVAAPEAAAVGRLPGGLVLGAVGALLIAVVGFLLWPIPRRAKEGLRADDAAPDGWQDSA